VEYDILLEKVGRRYKELLPSARGFEKAMISDRIQKISQLINDFVSMRISAGIREAPFFIELFGESAQGKSTVCDLLVTAMLKSQNLPIDKRYRAVVNPDEKFMSTWMTSTVAAILDDMGNAKSDFVEKPPTQMLINIANNIPFVAPKADLSSKGKVFVQPKIGMITTNVKHLCAYKYSMCPYSIQRRCHFIITVKAKPEFQRVDESGQPCGLDPQKVADFYATYDTVPVIQDLWDFDVEQAVMPKDITHEAKYEIYTWKFNGEEKRMESVNINTLIGFCVEQFAKHRKAQKELMRRHENQDELVMCSPECNHIRGCCPIHVPQQSGISEAHEFVTDIMERCSRWEFRISEWIPSFCQFDVTLPWLLLDRHNIIRDYKKLSLQNLGMTLVAICAAPILFPLILWYAVTRQLAMVEEVKRISRRRLMNKPLLRHLSAAIKSRYVQAFCALSATCAGIYAWTKWYKQFRPIMAQGNLAPSSFAEVESRDAERNVWAPVKRLPIPASDKSRCLDEKSLSNKVQKNLFFAEIETPGGALMANVFFPRTNIAILPKHYFVVPELKCKFYKDDSGATGLSFRGTLSLASAYHIPDTDLVVCYITTGGSFANLVDYFPEGDMPRHPIHTMWRRMDGTFLDGYGMYAPGTYRTTAGQFKGGRYENFSHDTFEGMCGAVVLSQTVGTCISGLHLGGWSNTPTGICGTITKAQLEDAIARVKEIPCVVLTGEASTFRTEIQGKPLLVEKPLSPKDPIGFMPHGSQIQYYGGVVGASSQKTRVRETPISEAVEEHLGIPNLWGPPKYSPYWWPYQTCMENASIGGTDLPHEHLNWAVVDYLSPLLNLLDQQPEWKNMQPMPHSVVVNGSSEKFINRIVTSTSIGLPFGGPKMRHMIELEPTEEHEYNLTFDDGMMEEIQFTENEYRQGRRTYQVAKACIKDEIISKKKEKCRIFYGNTLALTYLIRKYFLPILRFLQMNPLLSECAVGINCYSQEWQQLHDHIHRFENKVAGDYSKYDQKLPAQLILASLRICIEIAKRCNYSQEDITVMETLTSDIVYPFVAFNGSLVAFTESLHISGNSLTVIINGICGSLNLRCCFYDVYKSEVLKGLSFRDVVALITYGDDNNGSVKKGFEKYNMVQISEFLSKFGQTYTHPDKETELTPYLREEEMEFLKRKSVFHPRLGVNVGALDEKSIAKSLHNYIRDKNPVLTPDEACATNLCNAAREYFYHGQAVYEDRIVKLKNIAQATGLAHMCGDELDSTYSARVNQWHLDYGDGEALTDITT